MLKQVITLGLLSVTVASAISLPVQADTAVVQTSTTNVYVEGNGNESIQSTTQVNHTRRVNGRGSAATVQDSYSDAVILGNGNEVYQEQTQVNVSEEVNRNPRHRRQHGNNIQIRQR